MSTLQFKDPSTGKIVTAKAGSDYANRNSANQIQNVGYKDMISSNQGKSTVNTTYTNQTTPSSSSSGASYNSSPSYSSTQSTPSYASTPTYSSPSSYDSSTGLTTTSNGGYASVTGKNYGLDQNTLAEVQRKAQAGTALSNQNNAAAVKAYNDLQNYYKSQGATGQSGNPAPISSITNPYNNNWQSSSYLTDYAPVALNDRQVTNQEAWANNPLHIVNSARQDLISNAVSQGNWSAYNNFEAGQDPLKYDKGADGNYTQNKNYYAGLIQSMDMAMREAEMSGDTSQRAIYERELQDLAQKYNNAPGMAVYIPRVHGNDGINLYGIQGYDSNYFNSVYNQGSTGYIPHEQTVANWIGQSYDQNEYLQQWLVNNFSDGDGLGSYWTNNNFFAQNPNLLEQALTLSNSYGSEDEQKVRQEINALAMQNYLANQNYSAPVQQSVATPTTGYEQYIEQVLAPEVTASSPTVTPAVLGDLLQHIYSPGASSGDTGYTDNQVVQDNIYQRYLQQVLQGGF